MVSLSNGDGFETWTPPHGPGLEEKRRHCTSAVFGQTFWWSRKIDSFLDGFMDRFLDSFLDGFLDGFLDRNLIQKYIFGLESDKKIWQITIIF